MIIKDCEVSVVVPFLNEQDSIETLYRQITESLENKYEYEIIFVYDGSTDQTVEILGFLQQFDAKIHIICFSRNFGQTAALSAGFKYARGKAVVALDADLQNDPADIPKMLAKLFYENFDVVSGWRKKRHDNTIIRLLPSITANWIIRQITGIKLHDFGCTLKVYRKEVLSRIKLYGEMHRFIPALASWEGSPNM